MLPLPRYPLRLASRAFRLLVSIGHLAASASPGWLYHYRACAIAYVLDCHRATPLGAPLAHARVCLALALGAPFVPLPLFAYLGPKSISGTRGKDHVGFYKESDHGQDSTRARAMLSDISPFRPLLAMFSRKRWN